MRKRAAFVVAAMVATTLVPLIGGSAALAGTDTGPAGIVVTTPTPAGYTGYGSMRFRAIGSNTQGDEYLGVTDLGVGANRIESNFNNDAFGLGGNPGSRSGDCLGAYDIGSLGTPLGNSVSLTWDPTADTITSVFTTTTLSCTMVFGPGLAQELANARSITLAAAQALLTNVNALQVFIDDRQAGTTVDFTSVLVDSTFGIGPFVGNVGGQQSWLGTDYDFGSPNGFTVTGSLDLAGVFATCSETCKLEVSFGNYTPPNSPPTVDAGGPYSGNEGSPISLDGTVSDPDLDPVTTTWTSDAGAICSFFDASAVDTTVTCTDDGTYTLSLTANDGVNAAVIDTATLTVNQAPTISGTPPSPVNANTAYNFAFTLTGAPAPTTSVTSGSLPSGITLSSSGVLSGSAITAGSFTATVTATNGVAPDATTTFTIAVTPTVTISPVSAPKGTAVTLNGAGFVPGETVRFMYKTGLNPPKKLLLCSAIVTASGTAACSGTIPTGGNQGAKGAHTIVAKGTTSLIKAKTVFTLT